eukprot:scaffold7740_cov112-Isochrysis_galbana.AAC.9
MSDAAPSAAAVPEELAAAQAAKRAEIEARIAALRLKQAKEEEQKTLFFGDHPGITCDGCGVNIVGYRYKCKDCSNHDVCESCYDSHQKGVVTNSLGKQVISTKAEDHRFFLHKDKTFQPLVKKAAGMTEAKTAKTKPNDPCTCGSGIKFKKCCNT